MYASMSGCVVVVVCLYVTQEYYLMQQAQCVRFFLCLTHRLLGRRHTGRTLGGISMIASHLQHFTTV